MADWLTLLLKYGGFGAVLLLALFVMGKWLLRRITAALDSYTTAYLQQSAAIDARIERLEQLAEEQAKLTRTVESVKDEIAAQAKSRDNRWAFRKDVYVRIVVAILDLNRVFSTILTARRNLRTTMPDEARKDISETLQKACLDLGPKAHEYHIAFSLARLATADSILGPSIEAEANLFPDGAGVDYDTSLQKQISELSTLLREVFVAARKDLWETPEPEVKTEAANRQTSRHR